MLVQQLRHCEAFRSAGVWLSLTSDRSVCELPLQNTLQPCILCTLPGVLCLTAGWPGQGCCLHGAIPLKQIKGKHSRLCSVYMCPGKPVAAGSFWQQVCWACSRLVTPGC